MNISLYITTTPENHLDKSLTNERTISGKVRPNSDNSKENPIFVVSGNIEGFNYAKIGDHYYYIQDVKHNINGLTELYLHEDVLMTHRDTIRGLTAHITRRVGGNTYLPDPQFSAFGNRKIGMYKFSGSFNKNGNYVLVTAGG